MFLMGCLLLTACSSSQTITVESSATDFNMNNYDMPEEVFIEANQLLYDKNGLKITTDSLESDSAETFLILNVENTSDTNISLVCESSSVNSFVIRPYFSIELAAGDSALAPISFSNTDLNACEISTITEISFTLTAYDIKNYTLLYDTEPINIQTNQYGKYEQSINANGISLYDKNNIQIISKGFSVDNQWGDVIVLLIINKSDQNIHFGIDDSTAIANDNEYEVTFGCDVPSGCSAVQYIFFQDADGISTTEIDNASAIFTLTDTDSWKIIDKTPEIIFSK